MKKPLAYMATAVLLGVIVMLAPLQLLPSTGYPVSFGLMDRDLAERRSPSSQTLNGGSTVALQLTLLNSGLMLAFSFVFALGVFLYVRKRIV
jgi:uncharacterized iron-regulated membrane protein